MKLVVDNTKPKAITLVPKPQVAPTQELKGQLSYLRTLHVKMGVLLLELEKLVIK